MLNPGSYTLATRAITTAITGEAQTAISKLAGIVSALILINFVRGGGGTTCRVWVQVSPDNGISWIDVICAAFTTTSESRVYSLTAIAPGVTLGAAPTDGALADDTVVDGVLGSLMRAKITTTGIYSGNSRVDVYVDAK